MLKLDARIPIRYRLALTLVCVFTGAVLLADWIGLVPDDRKQLMQGRILLCESLAINGTAMVASDNSNGFENALKALVDRNDSLRSVRLVDPEGHSKFETSGHSEYWSNAPDQMASNISVPIFRFGQPWGDLQIAFVDTKTELGWSRYGTWGLLAFTIPICLLQFSFFIKRMVLALNPEGATPGNAMNGDREKHLQIVCDDLRSKPANPDSLLKCCQTNLGHGKTVSESTITNGQQTEEPADAEPPVVGNMVLQRSESRLGKENAPPIHTTIPIDDEELREVVVQFIDRMDARLSGMEDAVRQADFDTLQNEAHWLKGSGGTVGFNELTDPAIQLENAAKIGDTELALQILEEIQSIRARIVSPVAGGDSNSLPSESAPPTRSESPPSPPAEKADPGIRSASDEPSEKDNTPIECTLPMDDEDYREIVVDFVKRLDVRLMGMLSMVQSKSFEELENEAHWLKGAGGTVGFPALTPPATSLMHAARDGQVKRCQESLRDILQIRQRLVVPHTTNPTLSGQN